jgi:hypothetical protein
MAKGTVAVIGSGKSSSGMNNKKTSIGGNSSRIKLSSMNKHKKRGYKAYRGQGK